MEPNEGAVGAATPSISDAVDAAFDGAGSTVPTTSTPADVSSPTSPVSPPSAPGANTTPPTIAPDPAAMRLSDADMAKMVEVERSGGVKRLISIADLAKETRGANKASYEMHLANQELRQQIAADQAEIAAIRAAQNAPPPPQEELFDPFPEQNQSHLDPKTLEQMMVAVSQRELTKARQEAYNYQQHQAFTQSVNTASDTLARTVATDPVLAEMSYGNHADTVLLAIGKARSIYLTPGALSMEEHQAYTQNPSALIDHVLDSMKTEHTKSKEAARIAYIAETKQKIAEAGAPRVGGSGGLAPIPTSVSSQPKGDAELRAEMERQYDALLEARAHARG